MLYSGIHYVVVAAILPRYNSIKSAVGVINLVIFSRKSYVLRDFQGSVCPAVVDFRQLYVSSVSWCRRMLVRFIFDSRLLVFVAEGLVSFYIYPRARADRSNDSKDC